MAVAGRLEIVQQGSDYLDKQKLNLSLPPVRNRQASSSKSPEGSEALTRLYIPFFHQIRLAAAAFLPAVTSRSIVLVRVRYTVTVVCEIDSTVTVFVVVGGPAATEFRASEDILAAMTDLDREGTIVGRVLVMLV